MFSVCKDALSHTTEVQRASLVPNEFEEETAARGSSPMTRLISVLDELTSLKDRLLSVWPLPCDQFKIPSAIAHVPQAGAESAMPPSLSGRLMQLAEAADMASKWLPGVQEQKAQLTSKTEQDMSRSQPLPQTNPLRAIPENIGWPENVYKLSMNVEPESTLNGHQDQREAQLRQEAAVREGEPRIAESGNPNQVLEINFAVPILISSIKLSGVPVTQTTGSSLAASVQAASAPESKTRPPAVTNARRLAKVHPSSTPCDGASTSTLGKRARDAADAALNPRSKKCEPQRRYSKGKGKAVQE